MVGGISAFIFRIDLQSHPSDSVEREREGGRGGGGGGGGGV